MHGFSFFRHTAAAACAAALCAAADPAHAIINGNSSSLGVHMVRIIGGTGKPNCSGVALDRIHIVTAGHCRARYVLTDNDRIRVARTARSALLDDGKRVSVRGDAVIVTLRHQLPVSIRPIAIGAQDKGPFVIAGFGAVAESQRGRLGPLHEAIVVQHTASWLVDPQRDGELSASACYGDSGGAVIQNGALVGVITRASHPNPRRVCGHLTQFTPIMATGAGPVRSTAVSLAPEQKAVRRKAKRPRVTRR